MKKNMPITQVERDYQESANILSTTDLKGAISYFNGDFLAISGFEPDELQHKNHNVVRHPEMPPAAFDDLWSTVKKGMSWMGIVKNRCKNGDHYWVDAYVTPIRKNGRISEYQSVRRKPRREYVERAEQLYKQMMEGQSPACIRPAKLETTSKMVLATITSLLLGVGVTAAVAEVSIGALALMFGISAVLSSLAIAGLFSPYKLAVEQARKVNDNPVARHVYTGRNDDLGSILLAFKSLQSDTNGVVGRISDDSQRLSTSATGLSRILDKSNQSIQRQYTETDQVATAISEMTSSIHEVASNAQLTADSVEEAMREANKGRGVVTSTARAIESLAREIERASEVIAGVESNSQQINGILDVIKGVSEQTNLLALNAAIEAARAGEQGRGFAVVADEVRTLASRTNDSTAQIQKMIESLQAGTREAVSVMEQSREQAMGSVDQATSAASSIDAMSSAVERIKDMSITIASAVEQQSAVSRNISESIASIRDSSESTLQASNETAQASEEMAALASGLQELADEFWNRKQPR
jgi:aerotaxis receptor